MKSLAKLIKKPIIIFTLFSLLMLTGITLAFETNGTTTSFLPIVAYSEPSGEWPTIAGNNQRTSWSPEEVSGFLNVKWYRPIEAYIPQNVQIIAANGLLYVSTARGLYAINAENGNVAWRYDTELPLGNSPTVSNGIVYVGGYDRKLHALNAHTGAHLWSFDGAKAGYDTNPLVVNNKVIIGNRDGHMYAIGAHGSASQGQLIWQYETGGSIHLSAAYQNNKVYFASNDNHAYSLNSETGALVWKSAKLPGDGFHSFWPVIYRDMVIFSTAPGYRHNLAPGMRSIDGSGGSPYDSFYKMERDQLFPNQPDGTTLGAIGPSQPWTNGNSVIDASRIVDYLEDNPATDPNKYKPWRRAFIVLAQSNGNEMTFDADQDGHPDYIPVNRVGSNSGSRYPPAVGQDDVLYQFVVYQKFFIPQVRIMGWVPGTRQLSLLMGQGAIDEPAAMSIGGNVMYRNLCCDRVGEWANMYSPGVGQLWNYNNTLEDLAPGYDSMWRIMSDGRLNGWYTGNTNSNNAAYHNHGHQNAIIPYQGMLFAHRSNAIIAYGTGNGPGALPLLTINDVQDSPITPSANELVGRLEEEVQKIVDAGHLRPGYYNAGLFNIYGEFGDYFDNPGDTLGVLSRAYPHLSPQLQSEVRTYLQSEFNTYFNPTMYSTTGWAGAARESMPLPPEVASDLPDYTPRLQAGPAFVWSYPQHNFYAMWKYAEVFPGDSLTVYNLAKSKIEVPVPVFGTTDYFRQKPYELNAWIAGYIGFLELQELAGMDGTDAGLRNSVNTELNRLLILRRDIFTKESYWVTTSFLKKQLDIARNFMFMVPELGEYLDNNLHSQIVTAVNEYDYIAPYWFVSRYDAVIGEGAMSNLYNYHGLFLAKAYILDDSRQELTKYLDVSAFERGDLLYLQNLIAAIEAN